MNLVIKRSDELLIQIQSFQKSMTKKHPELMLNASFNFTLTLTKKKKLRCQYLSSTKEIDIKLCETVNTLHERLSCLATYKKLEFAKDLENRGVFHLLIRNEYKAKATKQLQLAI